MKRELLLEKLKNTNLLCPGLFWSIINLNYRYRILLQLYTNTLRNINAFLTG